MVNNSEYLLLIIPQTNYLKGLAENDSSRYMSELHAFKQMTNTMSFMSADRAEVYKLYGKMNFEVYLGWLFVIIPTLLVMVWYIFTEANPPVLFSFEVKTKKKADTMA